MVGASAPRGAGAPVGAVGPHPGQVSLTLASCGRLWPAAAGCGQLRSAVVRPDLARCGRPYTIALVQPSKVHLFIVILIFVYLQVKIPTKLMKPYYYLKCT
jgi:hypothetical protein